MNLAILQARVSSSRLPGKVLKPLAGAPMLTRQIERLRRVGSIDHFVVATSQDVADDAIERLCAEMSIDCYRGSLDDVLDRFYQAAKPFNPNTVIRLTGDCPVADPTLIEKVITWFDEGGYDYASNTITPTFPDGLDVEVMRYRCLQEAHVEATLPSEREHVTAFIYARPDRYSLGDYQNDIDLSPLRWTVDEPEDYELVSIFYDELFEEGNFFTTGDLLTLLERRPELKTMNKNFERNEGYQKSLQKDREIKE